VWFFIVGDTARKPATFQISDLKFQSRRTTADRLQNAWHSGRDEESRPDLFFISLARIEIPRFSRNDEIVYTSFRRCRAASAAAF